MNGSSGTENAYITLIMGQMSPFTDKLLEHDHG